MNKKRQNHFKKNLIVILTLIFVLGCTNKTVFGVSFPDYFPLDPAVHGFKTFQWTYGGTGTYSSYISGTLTVPYQLGAIEGTGIVNFSDVGTFYSTNDGNVVKWLGTDDFYFSSDQSLNGHPLVWLFSTVVDDMILDQGTFYNYYPSSGLYERDDNQSLSFDIQNVTVPLGTYSDAVIIWYLDEKYSFTTLDFDGKASGLGITLPVTSQTGGHSVTAFDVFAYGIGSIATGDVAAESGKLVNLAELIDIDFPDPVVVDIVPDTISTKTKWIRCDIRTSESYDLTDIQTESILLNGSIQPVRISEKRKEKKLVVTFSTSELSLDPGTIVLTITGELNDGTPFEGTDFVEVVKKGGKPS
ncbi:MAG: hypothetical protein ACYSTT_12840 [Planctomycetota bacterium]|jgi:hypothetical protein